MNDRLSCSTALGESLPAPHLLEIVTRHTGATICVVDNDLSILYANEAYANWFNARPKELLGRTLPPPPPEESKMSAFDTATATSSAGQQWNAQDYAIDAGFVPTLGGAVARLLDARAGERILDAARVCFSERGFHGASISAIAEVAGMSQGLIYRYFTNKAAIIRAITDEQREERREALAGMGVGADLHADVQHVPADQAARRVHDHVVADRVALGVEALEDAQRAVVVVAQNGALGVEAVVEIQLGVPGHGVSLGSPRRYLVCQKSRCGASISASSSATGPMTSMHF